MKDTLKRAIYASKIAEELESHYSANRDNGDNMIFAISGKWGEGKTELLKLLEPILKEKGFSIIKFNPWQYSQEDISLKRAFLRIVKDTIGNGNIDLDDLYYDRSRTVIDWRSLTPAFAVAVVLISTLFIFPLLADIPLDAFWGGILSAVKIFFGSGLGGTIITLVLIPLIIRTIVVSSRTAQISTAEQFEDKFQKLLDGRKKIVVFIDDLDRCTSKTVKIVLDSLRTFFCHKECSYIITGDHTVIERYAAEELYPNLNTDFTGKEREEGRRFLKKIFDVYWRLPLATPKVFREFIIDELTNSKIVLNDTQRLNIQSFLLDDGIFERNPRHVKRFVTALKFALESVKAQKDELAIQNTVADFEAKDQEKSIQEILNNPDLLAKILLIQEKFFPLYEKLVLFPDEIIVHEKLLRNGGKPEELKIRGEEILSILGDNNIDRRQKYSELINQAPQFTDSNNSTTNDPTNFIAFSGATGLPSLKGPDEANFPQYLKAGQLFEKLGATLEVAPKEKKERFAQRALQIFNDATTTEPEKQNILGEGLKVGAVIDEWASMIDEWMQKLYQLQPTPGTLAKEFCIAILQKRPDLISKVKNDKPQYFDSLWQTLETLNTEKLQKDSETQFESIVIASIEAQPINLKWAKIYLDKFDSAKVEEIIKSRLLDLPACKAYYNYCVTTLNDTNGKIPNIVVSKINEIIKEFANIDATLLDKEFLKSVNLFTKVQERIADWVKEQNQLIKLAQVRDSLELSDESKNIIRKHLISQIDKSGDLNFLEDTNVIEILSIDNKINEFKKLCDILIDINESVTKKVQAGNLLVRGSKIWQGAEIKDNIHEYLKKVNQQKNKLNKVDGLKGFAKTILESWGFDEPKDELKNETKIST